MSLGNNIANLRKQINLTQEELAWKVGVTRQTISKWELDETTPDVKQAKMLSFIFNVSLDELTDNNIDSVLIKKVSNTEKLAGIAIKILGVGLIVFILILILLVVVFCMRYVSYDDRKVAGNISISCKISGEEYVYYIEHNKDFQVINTGGDAYIYNHVDLFLYDDANQMVAHIEDYFYDHGGVCVID